MTAKRSKLKPMNDHYQQLYVDGNSFVHNLDPALKIASTFLFVVAVALLPRYQFLPAGLNLLAVTAVLLVARLQPRMVLSRLLVVAPFVGFAFLIPFVATGPKMDVAGVALSTEGLWSTWNILTKAMLGASASIILSSTTSIPELLQGFSRLRVPAVLVAIVAFMFRYLGLITDEIHRMRNAMTARAHDPRWFWQVKPMATSAGALFVRTYERGERAHLAMMARGYSGQMPSLAVEQPEARSRTIANVALAMLPAVAAWINLAVAFQLVPTR